MAKKNTDPTAERSHEEVRLKKAVATARAEFTKLWRRQTQLRHGDTVIASEPEGELAQAQKKYNAARSQYLSFVKTNQGELRERQVAIVEEADLVRDKRMFMFTAAFGRALANSEALKSLLTKGISFYEWSKKHPKEAGALLATALVLGLGALAAVFPAVAVASWAAGVAVGVPAVFTFRHIALKLSEEDAMDAAENQNADISKEGRALARRRRLSKLVSTALGVGLGFGVRNTLQDIMVNQLGVSPKETLISSAEAAPHAPRPGVAGEVTPEEAAVIRGVNGEYQRWIDAFNGKIRALEAQHNEFINKIRTQYANQPAILEQKLREAEINFKMGINVLKGSVEYLQNTARSADKVLYTIAAEPPDPRYPNKLIEEANIWRGRLQQDVADVRTRVANFESYVRTGRTEYVEGALSPEQIPQEGQFVQVGYESPMTIESPTDFQEYIAAQGALAKQALMTHLDTLVAPPKGAQDTTLIATLEQKRQAVLNAMTQVDALVQERAKNAIEFPEFMDKEQGPKYLREFASMARKQIQAIEEGVMGAKAPEPRLES